MVKTLKFHEEALNAVLRGVKTLAKAVTVTLGPKGRNVVIAKEFGAPSSTKDGVSVAKEIALKDSYENVGAQLVKQAASKVSDVAGDGTTTAIVLADAIFSEGVKQVAAGANPMDLKRGIDLAVREIDQFLTHLAKPIQKHEEIQQIATISANNDEEIGKILANAMEKVGKDGIVTIGEAKGMATELDVVEGMQFDKGFLSPYFVTNAEKMEVEFENPQILITDKKLSNAKEMGALLEKVMEKGARPFLIIADDVEGEALATLVINKIKGGFPIAAVKAPAFGDRRKEMLKDLAVLVGTEIVSEELGHNIEDVNPNILGSAKKVKISKEATTLVDGMGSSREIEERVTLIKAELRQEKLSDYEREKLEERLAKLVGGVAVINVGAATEAEANEKKDRIEDALHATRAAIAQGIVPGGGVALIRATRALEKLKVSHDEAIGVEIVKSACFAPLVAIANNCGVKGDLIAEKVHEKEGSFGYNGLTDTFSDLVKDGVIDPVFVTKSTLLHAASIAGMLLTISAVVVEKKEPKKLASAPMGGGAPGMGGMGPMGGMGGMGGMDFGSMM